MHPTTKRTLWLLTAATLIAAALRLINLGGLPPPAWYDEVWYGLRAREMLQTGQVTVFYETYFGGANAGPVWVTAAAHLLGFDAIWGARLWPALIGTVSVPLAYACFRELLRSDEGITLRAQQQRIVAILAALVLVYTLFYTTIGRMGMENGLAPATALFVVWQLTRGAHRRAWSGYVLAGLVGGLAQYNGLHARFILPLMGVLWLQHFILAQPGDRRRMFLGGLTVAGVGALVNIPLLSFFLTNPDWFTARADIVTSYIGPGRPYPTIWHMYAENAVNILKVYTIEGSYDAKNGVPGVPLLDWVQAGGFYVGLAWIAFHLRKSYVAWLLPMWMIITAMPSFLTEGAPNLGRMIGVASPVAAIVALGWVTLYNLATSQLEGGRLRWALPGIATAMLAGSAAYHSYLLFVQWPQAEGLDRAFTTATVETVYTMEARDTEGVAYAQIIPEMPEDIAAFAYLMPEAGIERMDFRKCLPVPHERDTPTSYLILRGHDRETADFLTRLYPEAVIAQDGIDLFQTSGTLVEIPAGATAPRPPLAPVAEFANGMTLHGYLWDGPEVQAGGSLLLTLYWHFTGELDTDLTAFAHLGTGLAGEQPIVAQRDGAPCLGFHPTSAWRAGEIVPDGFALEIPPDTPPGEYPLSVGWYEWPSLEPLPLQNAAQPLTGERAVIGTVTVTAP